MPIYDTPGQAVRAFMHLVRYRRSQEVLIETPPSVPEAFTPDTARRASRSSARSRRARDWLSEPDAKAVLAAYGIPVFDTVIAASVAEAPQAARRIGFPVALKILSPDITHKSDIGGVMLGLADELQLQAAAEAMLARAAAARPQAARARYLFISSSP